MSELEANLGLLKELEDLTIGLYISTAICTASHNPRQIITVGLT